MNYIINYYKIKNKNRFIIIFKHFIFNGHSNGRR